jgi:hypothetical protein
MSKPIVGLNHVAPMWLGGSKELQRPQAFFAAEAGGTWPIPAAWIDAMDE